MCSGGRQHDPSDDYSIRLCVSANNNNPFGIIESYCDLSGCCDGAQETEAPQRVMRMGRRI